MINNEVSVNRNQEELMLFGFHIKIIKRNESKSENSAIPISHNFTREAYM